MDMLKLCLEYGAELYASDYQGRKPIHAAAASHVQSQTGQIDTLVYLLETIGKPEDVNIEDCDKRTPLHEAAKWGRLPAIKYLVEKGASVFAHNKFDKTPEDEADDNHKLETVKVLRELKKGP